MVQIQKRSLNKSRLYAKGGMGGGGRRCTLLIFFPNQFPFGICTAQAQRKNPDSKLTGSHVFFAFAYNTQAQCKTFLLLLFPLKKGGLSQNTPAD